MMNNNELAELIIEQANDAVIYANHQAIFNAGMLLLADYLDFLKPKYLGKV
jgi:hypothetical protein